MRLLQPVRDLRAIFADYIAAAREHGSRPVSASFRFLRENHLGLVLLYPVFALACPYVWIVKGRISPATQIVMPVLLVGVFLLLALLYDKIMEHSRPPSLPEDKEIRNLAVFLHLPVSAAGMFFFLHPGLGYLMVFAAAIYSILMSIRAQSLAHGRGLGDAFSRYIGAGLLLMVPLVLMLLAFNILRTVRIFKSLE